MMATDAYPTLTTTDVATMATFGTQRQVAAGEVLYRPGDVPDALIVVLSGAVTVTAGTGRGVQIVTVHGPRQFLGELSVLDGQRVHVTARAEERMEILAVPVPNLHHLFVVAPDICDTVLTAYAARRAILTDEGANAIRIVGSRFSSETLAVRAFLVRNQIPHQWLDVDTEPDAARLAAGFGLTPSDFPVVVTGGPVLRRAAPSTVGAYLGLTIEAPPDHCVDVLVVGAGPAGLAASVYAASEGLRTLVVDSVAPGGQAGTSSRIENYLGFPTGISGLELSNRAMAQARKFGAVLATPCTATSISEGGHHLVVGLIDGTSLGGRAVVVATGARYRRLDIERIDDFEGAGIYYAATGVEAGLCQDAPVVVVGGGNSAGQAALFLAGAGCTVTLVIRANDLSASMSSYLADRIAAHPGIALRTRTVVTALDGHSSLSQVTLRHPDRGSTDIPTSGLFSFIGADPATTWLDRVAATDDRGFIRTDRDIDRSTLGHEWKAAGRDPLPYETNRIGLFAVGDVRSGSLKRVASAVGEGSAVVRSIHSHLSFAH